MGIHVNLVINNRIYREGIADYFRGSDEFVLGAMFHSLADADSRLTAFSSDVVIVDSLVTDLLSLIHRIKSQRQSIKIILIILDHENLHLNDCVAAGVEGIVTASDGMADLRNCIHNVYAGRICYPAEIVRMLIYQPRRQPLLELHYDDVDSGLTSRQLGIIHLLENGFSNKEIARKLGIEISTVKNHVHQILQRLKAKSRCEAVAMYRRTRERSLDLV